MTFKPGVSGNPTGRPKGTGLNVLLEAIDKVEKKYDIDYWQRAVEISLEKESIMNKILGKIIPDPDITGNILITGDLDIEYKSDTGNSTTTAPTTDTGK